MSDVALIYATFPDAAAAERIAEAVVAERLAACANILSPCRSIYRWQGEVERAAEVPALFKTTPALVDQLRARIAELHPYDVPAVEAWPVAASDAVAAWVEEETA